MQMHIFVNKQKPDEHFSHTTQTEERRDNILKLNYDFIKKHF